jgi:hypothetical protein
MVWVMVDGDGDGEVGRFIFYLSSTPERETREGEETNY